MFVNFWAIALIFFAIFWRTSLRRLVAVENFGKLCCLSDNKSRYRLIFIQQQHDACQKGTPPLDSPVPNLVGTNKIIIFVFLE